MTAAAPSPAADFSAPSVAVLLVAAGRGIRMGGDLPKQYRQIVGKTVIARTIEAFLAHPAVTQIVTAIHADDTDLYGAAIEGVGDRTGRLKPPVPGGATRQASVLAGLEAIAAEPPDLVLIHDAVRPFVTMETIDAALDALAERPAICIGMPVVDTVKRADPAGVVDATVPREGLWRAATPQGFHFGMILDAHRRAGAAGRTDLTDDAAVAEWAGHRVLMVPCDDGNVKLTTQRDFTAAESRLTAAAYLERPDVRTGVGYDVHVLEPGDGVWLGGVHIPHTHRLKGHSDADVALHALTDAILGAIGDGDIGQHFPPTDERWRGCASAVFLADAVRRVTARGGIVAHCDVTVVAEAPRIGPHREAIRAEIARICGVTIDRVGFKATTNEGIGFAGRREGIAAMASATVRLPV